MSQFLENIRAILPKYDESHRDLNFKDAGIDSMDLVALRVSFESLIGRRIPDGIWLDFTSIGHLVDYSNRNQKEKTTDRSEASGTAAKKRIVINMPQMALEALSENWLFKEIGGVHWDMICDGLGQSSFNLKDDIGNRLYATFVRIRIECSNTLKDFIENDFLDFDGSISRFGESMYFSEIEIQSKQQVINANLMTTFSIRNESDNRRLTKSQPAPGQNKVEQKNQMPDFGNDYRLLKKGEISKLQSGNETFSIVEKSIFQTEYTLNPFYDLNGVNLLYFAAYPIINDVCEARYFNAQDAYEARWEQTYYTHSKDILYYGNCNIDETIIYDLIEVTELPRGKIKIQSVLSRKSDNQIIGRVFAVKGLATS